ncbi:rRNA pseudouridine synthase [Helicobacter muridarum]|uniref:Pseudouridine synthase n=1 Tax=Helicobacter muridarum TaxID=216 RepID=A0A099U1T8_9HELI|nr:pseudouridine synthase [Helicobacter muridarum]TLE01183.1 rRNA pseudouridine synthase [Helicobacter muridarum]STQ86059.1 RNA pseudouridine synthase [Helicobacter muridarum]
MRLNQFISLHSKHSRRESDMLIELGRVRVNHSIATRHTKVPDIAINNPIEAQKDFKIFIDNKPIYYSKFNSRNNWSAIVYHKKKGELVSKFDPKGRALIYDSIDSKYSHFMPVGRLDFASEGLLILSDSKAVVCALMESELPRVYIVKIDSKINDKIIYAMSNGISLKDARAGGHSHSKIISMDFPAMEFKIIRNSKISKLKLCIKEGKNREIRRFFAHFNANVLDLRRVSYGFVNLNALPLGKTRFFTREEYRDLKNFMLLPKELI